MPTLPGSMPTQAEETSQLKWDHSVDCERDVFSFIAIASFDLVASKDMMHQGMHIMCKKENPKVDKKKTSLQGSLQQISFQDVNDKSTVLVQSMPESVISSYPVCI